VGSLDVTFRSKVAAVACSVGASLTDLPVVPEEAAAEDAVERLLLC